ncbi:hypothetical protein H9649_12070 [Sporosarcina sp. Sa2YVA2]|uniref:Uncharacterized protein n=1 Tax=Sporosarcina quadrami TaxID=2762234 RepID=A0ABR8UBB8_9BACL|nr:hypothetical protein [Sporosarcina quadrami]MBD7985326.1 hypothetical protein [Sporosarcina quadrami]
MSLAMCILQNDYIIACADSAVAYFPDDGEKEATQFRSDKIFKLSDKVFFIATGKSILVSILKVELREVLSSNADLIMCMAVAERVLKDLKKGIVRNPEKIIRDLSDKLEMDFHYERDIEPALSLFQKDDYVDMAAYLIGFTDAGRSGMVDIRSSSFVKTPEDSLKGFPLIILGPDDEFNDDADQFSKYQKILIPPIEQRTFDNFMSRMVYVHAQISADNPINVSTDANFQILTKHNGEIMWQETKIDTLQFYKEWGLG